MGMMIGLALSPVAGGAAIDTRVVGANTVFDFDASTLSDGAVSSFSSRSTPARSVGQPTSDNRPVASSGVLSFDGTNDVLYYSDFPDLPNTLAQNLPDVSDVNPDAGFVCTGLAWDEEENCWWMGDHGLGHGRATFNSKIVQVSEDGTTLLSEISITGLVPTAESVQGVAVDSSDDTLWCVVINLQSLVHVTKAGALLGTVDLSGIGNPNGVTYDAGTDSLYVTIDGNSIHRVNKSGVSQESFSVPSAGVMEHLALDPVNNWIWYSNQTGTEIRGYDLDLKSTVAFGSLSNADEAEGIAVRGSDLWVCHDGQYHGGNPLANQLQRYTIPAKGLIPGAKTSEINIFYVAPLASYTSGTVSLFTFGNPVSQAEAAIAVMAPNGTNTRVFVTGIAGGGVGFVDRAVNPTTRQKVRIHIDAAAETVAFYVDGTLVGTVGSLSAMSGGETVINRPRIGASIEGVNPSRHSTVQLERLIVTKGALSSEQIAACYAALPS